MYRHLAASAARGCRGIAATAASRARAIGRAAILLTCPTVLVRVAYVCVCMYIQIVIEHVLDHLRKA